MSSSWFKDVFLPHLALFLVPVFASANATICRAAFSLTTTPGTEPLNFFALAVWRTLIAASIFLTLRFFSGRNKTTTITTTTTATSSPCCCGDIDPPPEVQASVSLKDKVQLGVLGFIGVSVNIIFFLMGISWTDGVTAACFMTAVPPICYFISWRAGQESFSFAKGVATCCVLVGNLIFAHVWKLFQQRDNEEQQLNNQLRHTLKYYTGCLSLILNQICFALYLVYQKPLLAKFSVVDFFSGLMTAALFGLLFFSLFPRENLVTDQVISRPETLTWMAWLAIFYAGLIQSCLVFFLLAYGIKKSGSPVLASIVNSLQPFLIVIASVVLLGETIDKWQKIGGGIVCVGVFCSGYVSVTENMTVSSSSNKSNKSEDGDGDGDGGDEGVSKEAETV